MEERLNLIPAIRGIEKQISVIKAKHAQELRPYEESLKHLRELNDICEKCNGTGKVYKMSYLEDESEYVKCEACNGTGLKNFNTVWN